MAVDNKQIAHEVLAAVGGKGNVTAVQHCMTRLRFNLKDQSLADDDAVKVVKGVAGVQRAGGQYQVIVGQNVPKVYDALCAEAGIAKLDAIDENLDTPKKKLTVNGAIEAIFNYLSGSMIQLIPLIMACGLCKAVSALIGPDLLNLISEESDLYILLDFVYDAGFYFMPVFLGYSTSKKLNCSPVLGLLMGAILIAPDFVALAGTSFSVFGIPTTAYNYSSTVLPILLTMPVLALVEKLLKKYVPSTLSTVFVPFLTIAIMLPVSLCLLAPLGNYCSTGVNAIIDAIDSVAGPFAVALVGAVWQLLVMTGMHSVVINLALVAFLENGYMSGAIIGSSVAAVAVWGTTFGAVLRLKDKDERALNLSYFISGVVGGVTEPALYGLCFKYKRTFLGIIIGGFAGGLLLGFTGVRTYLFGASNFLSVLSYTGGSTENLVFGVLAWAITFTVSAAVTYFLGFSKEELEGSAA